VRMSRIRVPAAVVASTLVLALSGCSGAATPNLGDVGASISSAVAGADAGIKEARTAIDDARAKLENLTPAARTAVEGAISSSAAAIDEATAALKEAGKGGASATATAAQSETALADAKAKLDAAASSVDGVTKGALQALSAKIDALSTQLKATHS
jgi:uncharacterized protein YqgV (UPF0045/DUF77 family)